MSSWFYFHAFNIFKWILRLIFLACFFTHMRVTVKYKSFFPPFDGISAQFEKYIERLTLILEEDFEVEFNKLPQLTICSADGPYKNDGFHFNKSSFDANTYDFDDFFAKGAKEALDEKVSEVNAHMLFEHFKGFVIKELQFQTFGKCFGLTSDYAFRNVSDNLKLLFRSEDAGGVKPLIIIHHPGEELYIIANAFPTEMEHEDVDETSTCTITPEEKVFQDMWKSPFTCKEWSYAEFFDCATNKFD